MLHMEEIENWDGLYWAYNVPLQMWPNDDGSKRVINYMPRKEACRELEEHVSPDDLPAFCRNASTVLRNLADLFDALGEGKIDMIYYPDERVADAITKAAEDRGSGDASHDD